MNRKKKRGGKAAKKRMTFAERKTRAEKWVSEFDGTAYNGDIVKAYRKKFAVDRMTSVRELQLLGVEITAEQIQREKEVIERYKQHLLNKKRKKRLKKELAKETELEQDDTFFFIAGYTSGGAPYGITWDEIGMEDAEEDEDVFE